MLPVRNRCNATGTSASGGGGGGSGGGGRGIGGTFVVVLLLRVASPAFRRTRGLLALPSPVAPVGVAAVAPTRKKLPPLTAFVARLRTVASGKPLKPGITQLIIVARNTSSATHVIKKGFFNQFKIF